MATEKLFFYDLETTGLDSKKHCIHQLAGAIVIDNEIKEKFNFNIQPFENAVIDNDALKIGNVTKEQIMLYPEMSIIYSLLINMLSKYVNKYDSSDKFHLVGYNINAFDNRFFRQFFIRNNDSYFGSWFWADSIDIYVLASNKFKKERSKFPNFKQFTIAKKLGIEVDENKLHNAEYDISLCIDIYKLVS